MKKEYGMNEYTNIKSNIDKCTAREKYLIDIIEKMKEGYDKLWELLNGEGVHPGQDFIYPVDDEVILTMTDIISENLKLTEE